MKSVTRKHIVRAVVLTPAVVLISVFVNLVGYMLALNGIIIIRESPWHYAAREFYVYHGRAIVQLEPGYVEYDEHLLYRPRNGVFVFNNYEFRTTIESINGQRKNPYLHTSPDIIILGDSFAQGWGVNDRDTVASALTRDFGLKALSSGVSSYNTAREFHAFRRSLSNGILPRPPHLIIFYCTNDYTENMYFLAHGIKSYTPQDFSVQVSRARDNTAKTNLLVAPLINHVQALRQGYLKCFAMAKSGLDYGNLYDPEPPVSCTEQVRAFKAVLDANLDIIENSKVTVVSFKGWGGKDNFGQALAATPFLANNTKIKVVPNTVPPSGYFPLDGHLNEDGSRYLAGLIAAQIYTKDQPIEDEVAR